MQKISKKQQGEAVKTLIQFMIDVWEQNGNENLDTMYGLLNDTFWTARRIAIRYNLKEIEMLDAFQIWINANYRIEGYKDRIGVIQR